MIPGESEVIVTKYVVVGGGWSGVSRTGDPFVRLKFKSAIPENTMVTMWKSRNKTSDRHPDYLIMAAVKEDEKHETPEELF